MNHPFDSDGRCRGTINPVVDCPSMKRLLHDIPKRHNSKITGCQDWTLLSLISRTGYCGSIWCRLLGRCLFSCISTLALIIILGHPLLMFHLLKLFSFESHSMRPNRRYLVSQSGHDLGASVPTIAMDCDVYIWYQLLGSKDGSPLPKVPRKLPPTK